MEITPKNEQLAQKIIKLLSSYLDDQINLEQFRLRFDSIYYSYSYDEKHFAIELMEKISLATANENEAASPDSPCLISEDELKQYIRRYKGELQSAIDRKTP